MQPNSQVGRWCLAWVVVIGVQFASVELVRADEPLVLSVDLSGVMPLGEPQSRLFGVGGSVGVAAFVPVIPSVLLGGRLRGGLLLDGDAPLETGLADPSGGNFGSLSLAARLRPLAFNDPATRRGVGPYVDLGVGGVLTGGLFRAGFEAGLGWGFDVGPVVVGPTARFIQLLQPSGGLESTDARLLLVGVELVLNDELPPEATPAERDRDGDGILDHADACPDEPEDLDGFEDADGCPDPDNDQDSILDVDDACPNEPEDPDGWEDEDGCPEPDNDSDLVLDVDDQCPNESEVVNGNEDDDGCPDEGLIELVDNRIVLDSRVLFDTDRIRVRRHARGLLEAIINLWRQHPEWTRVRIEGHADFRGAPRYNQILSERRARKVMEQLIERGMPAEILEAVGYGSTRPRTRGDSESSLQVNRRVEFLVLSSSDAQASELATDDPAEGGDDEAGAPSEAEDAAEAAQEVEEAVQ